MEKKEHNFAGKHYLMKQAFGQEELHEREAVCTREEPPQCTASCPLHLDMRLACSLAGEGNFSKAAGVLRKATPFLHLLAKCCTAPCRKKCTMAKLGDGISMQVIEEACARYGGSGVMNRFMIPKKKISAGVAGNDLFALACCWELGKKGYEVIWYTQRSSMEEILEDWGLSEDESKQDLRAMEGFRIQMITEERTAAKQVQKWGQETAVFCISPELAEWKKGENCFCGRGYEEVPWILAEAKYRSLMAERYLQGADPHEVPDPEVYESRLFVTMDGVKGSKRAAEIESFTREEAQAEGARCMQCQCLECIKGCVYLQDYKRNPRGAIREIYNNMSIVMGNHMANKMINSCDECGQCKAACPNGFDYPSVCRIARQTMVETEKMPPSAHEFALLDQEFSNGEGFLSRKQPGYDRCAYLFFPGCQAAAVSPKTVEIAYLNLMERLEGGVGLVLGCCGAISDWAGREDLFARAMERFCKAWEEQGKPQVICACPTCKKIFENHTDLKPQGIWEVLMETGIEKITEQTVAIHDACGSRDDARTREAVREFVKALGCEIREIPMEQEIAPCCGYGGLVSYANREMSEKKARFAASRAEGRILTYCMACRDQFSRVGADSCHILELAYGIEPGAVPDLSERRANRLKLKETLQKKIWKEETSVGEQLKITYAPGVEGLMDERMILKSDVEEVLKAYEKNQAAVEDQEQGYLVTNSRIGNVTFWVKFTREDYGYLVHGAYSHRMTVE
mgnify:FL=1